MSAAAPRAFDQRVEIRVGKHLFRWEPPDICYLAYDGDVDSDAAQRLSDISRVFTVPQRYVLLLIDLSRTGTISAEARKRSAKGGKGVPIRGVAVFGASPLMRVLASLVGRASDLLSGNTDNPTRFFATEAEARAFLTERRRILLASGVGPNV
jgi:hypothetical protein